MRSIPILKHRRHDLIVDSHNLPHQSRPPAALAIRMVQLVSLCVPHCGTEPAWQLHRQKVHTLVNLVDVDGTGPGADGWETDFQGPEHQGSPLPWDYGGGCFGKTALFGPVAVDVFIAGCQDPLEDFFPGLEHVVLSRG